jgi:hypothetical protein
VWFPGRDPGSFDPTRRRPRPARTPLYDEEDLDRVHERFGRWIRDACSLEYDQDRLNYRHEIGRRHHREGVEETVHVRFENVTV